MPRRWARVVALVGLGCLGAPRVEAQALSLQGEAAKRPTGPPNVLLVLVDDFGVDSIAAYGEHPVPAHTPVLDALAGDGVLFRNAWSAPTCSPTRAMVLTGRLPSRTGIGSVIAYADHDDELALDELLVPELLPGHRSAAVGKWHLTSLGATGALHPNAQGFERFAGTMENIPNGGDYYHYEKTVDGTTFVRDAYATSDQVDDALAFVAESTQPWFLYLAFNAAHTPYHAPPDALHTYELPPLVADDPPLYARAVAEALDSELGRLLEGLDPLTRARTVVIVAGDNGTAPPAVMPPWSQSKAKETVFEGGINVPLLVSGPGVGRGECAGLVVLTDLFATVLELCGRPLQGGDDSVSLVPYLLDPGRPSIRPWAYVEYQRPNGLLPVYADRKRAVRDGRYKLVHLHVGSATPTRVLFYDLLLDPFEAVDLVLAGIPPEAQGAFEALSALLAPGTTPSWP